VLEGLPSQPDGVNETEWMDACALVEHAVLQRPLLGSVQDSDWTTYGYLDRDEVRRLLDYRRRFPSLGEDNTVLRRPSSGGLAKSRRRGSTTGSTLPSDPQRTLTIHSAPATS
jgi:hypothetical protein